MRFISFALILLLIACNSDPNKEADDSAVPKSIDTTNPVFDPHPRTHDTTDVYSNETFKDVVVKKTGETTYSVTGKARVFEAVYLHG